MTHYAAQLEAPLGLQISQLCHLHVFRVSQDFFDARLQPDKIVALRVKGNSGAMTWK